MCDPNRLAFPLLFADVLDLRTWSETDKTEDFSITRTARTLYAKPNYFILLCRHTFLGRYKVSAFSNVPCQSNPSTDTNCLAHLTPLSRFAPRSITSLRRPLIDSFRCSFFSPPPRPSFLAATHVHAVSLRNERSLLH